MSGPQFRTIQVLQGEYEVSNLETDVITTILGSCVATCMWDPVNKIGGMNHFLLADRDLGEVKNSRFGLHSMELLINSLMKLGAERHLLTAKLFGGAILSNGLGSIGEDNARFARQFLTTEGIPCLGESLGGNSARKLRFWPTNGRAQQMLLNDSEAPEPKHGQKSERSHSSDKDIAFF